MAFSGKKYLALALTGAVILGAGTYILLNNYFERINIAVAAGNIEKNSKIEEKDVMMLPYYKQALPEGYISEKSEAIGMIIKAERKTGDPLTTGLFNGEDTAGGVFEGMAEGEVLMAISLNYQEPLMDELKIGNSISIVSTEKEKESNYYSAGNLDTSSAYGNSVDMTIPNIPEITSGNTPNETAGTSSNKASDSSSNEVAKSTASETADSTTTETTDSATTKTTINASAETKGDTTSETAIVAIVETSDGVTNENTGNAPDENAGSTGKSIIDLSSFSLDENIMIIDGQIIIKNLKIVDIKKTDTESNGLITAKNKSSWCIFIKCSIKEAPVISRITREDKYKIFLEKVLTE
jgi:hypothetical protein